MNVNATCPDRPHGARPPDQGPELPVGADDASLHTQFYFPTSTLQPLAGLPVDPPLPLAVDRYMLVEELARGGMGVIYRALEPAFHREVAVKVLLAAHALKPQLCRRARVEALVTAQLDHPGVVPVYGFGDLPDGRPYFAMRIVRGNTLAELLRDRADPAAGVPRLLKVFEQVCLALSYAHSCGVVHRDLKPANILVAAFGKVKLIDWGVAKVLPGSPLERSCPTVNLAADDSGELAGGGTRYGVVVGTAEYMAPEQVGGDPSAVDARADVFALGGLLCHILTGHPPYTDPSFRKVLEMAAAADLGDALARLGDCGADPPLVRLAKKCLALNPSDRPADAGVVAGELVAYLESRLEQVERDMARFFELSLDLFAIAGLDGYFKRVNGNFSRTLGHDPTELLRHPFLHFVHPDDWPATQAVMEQLNAGQPVVRFRNRYRDVRGQYRQLEWTAKAVPDEGVVFAIARDVTPTYVE